MVTMLLSLNIYFQTYYGFYSLNYSLKAAKQKKVFADSPTSYPRPCISHFGQFAINCIGTILLYVIVQHYSIYHAINLHVLMATLGYCSIM